MLVIAAKTEEDIASLETYEDKQMFLEELGLEESGVNRLIKKAYNLLNLQTFITAGEMEVKAWTYYKGWKAPQCAGVIHTDFEKGFIRAEVIKYDDYMQYGSEAAVREAGKLPSVPVLQAEYEKLQGQKESLYADYGKLKKQVQEYDVIKRNIDSILQTEKQPERERQTERG
jgi:ribosome-binding ATPase YchF (GTP1/OBG family)